MSKNGISVMPNSGIDKHIETVCRSMAKRAADYTDTDVDANAGAEFTKAVRSVVINTARDVAAFAAEQTVSETHNE
jgi:hypothetical protein